MPVESGDDLRGDVSHGRRRAGIVFVATRFTDLVVGERKKHFTATVLAEGRIISANFVGTVLRANILATKCLTLDSGTFGGSRGSH